MALPHRLRRLLLKPLLRLLRLLLHLLGGVRRQLMVHLLLVLPVLALPLLE